MTEEPHAEGWFASEQEAVAEEAAWADQMEQEAAGAELVLATTGPVDAPVNPLDIPDRYDLPMFGSVAACPKCGLGSGEEDRAAFRVNYHPHGVLGAPCGETFGWPEVQNLGEHLCMVCSRCHYGLPMAVWRG